MHAIRLLSSPPAIAIDDEPLDVEPGDAPAVSVEGFELVPAWQVCPARGRRRVLATLPAIAVAVAVALSVGGGDDATLMRAGPVGPAARPQPALVVQASSAPATDGSRARR